MIRSFGAHKPKIHDTAFVHDSAEVIGRVSLAAGVSVWPLCVLRGDVNRIAVGEDSNIQDLCVLHGDHDHPAVIGRGVTIGHGAVVHGCRIGDGCLIGMGARILGGVIGRESLVAAGAVVPPGLRVPPRSLVLGLPAKIARRLDREELRHMKRVASAYVRCAQAHRRGSSVLP